MVKLLGILPNFRSKHIAYIFMLMFPVRIILVVGSGLKFFC